jgi:hypothetical protein
MRTSGVEEEGGIAKMAVHLLPERRTSPDGKVPIEDYMIYSATFSVIAESLLADRKSGGFPEKKQILFGVLNGQSKSVDPGWFNNRFEHCLMSP